jgi:uncharacterized membrane protein HdeD (DUF308 family)
VSKKKVIPMRSAMADYWWTITLRGLVAVLFGVGALIWPDIAIQSLVILFGMFVLIDGVVNLSVARRASKVHERWWVLLIQGAVGVGVGIVSFAWPAVTAVALLYMVAFWAIAIGMLEIAAGMRLSRNTNGGWLLTGCGVGSALLGAFLMAWPNAALHGIVWLIGGGAIFFGSLLILLGLKMKRLGIELSEDEFTVL